MKIEIKKIVDGVVRVTTTDERWYLKDGEPEPYTSSTWIASYVPSKELAIWMAKMGWDEAELVKREAGARGSRVHKGIEVLSAGSEVFHNDSFTDGEGEMAELTADEYEAILSFKQWYDEVKPKFLKTEHTVFNKEHRYAGTLDAMCEIGGEIWIIDYKTSAKVFLSHVVQLSSYFHADGIKADKMGILQVGYKANKHKKWKFTEIKDKFDGFLHAKYFWNEANEGVSPKQKDYPKSIKLNKEKL